MFHEKFSLFDIGLRSPDLLSAFLKPGADLKTLSAGLKPATADYAAVFTADYATKVEAAHAALWATNPETFRR